jgi:hypothetical protein
MSPRLTAIRAAVLTLRAARAAARHAPVKTAEYGEHLDRAEKAEALGRIDERLRERTAADVLELNARITLSAARVRRAGSRIALPEQLELGGCDVRRASEWCVHAAGHLEAAQIALHQRIDQHQSAGELDPYASAQRARYEAMLLERYRGQAGGPIVTRLDADMWVALRSLDPDADEAEHARVLDAIAQVARLASYAPEAGPFVVRLRSTIDTINDAAAGRRLAATWLHALESTIAISIPKPLFFEHSKAELRRVLSADAELDEAVRHRASRATEWAYQEVTRIHLREHQIDGADGQHG